MEKPLISVIMATYNYGRFISEAIDSILAQTYPHFELIIIDDASTDNTQEMIAQYNDNRIKCITRSICTNSGSLARNDGLKIAQGDLIAIADSDDVSLPDRFEKQVHHFQTYPNIDLLGGAMIRTNEHGRPIDRPKGRPIYKQAYKYRQALLKDRLVIFNPTLMFKKHVLDKVPQFNDCACSADFEFQLRASRHFTFFNRPDVLVYYRRHPESVSRIYAPLLKDYYHKIFMIREHIWIQKDLERKEYEQQKKR